METSSDTLIVNQRLTEERRRRKSTPNAITQLAPGIAAQVVTNSLKLNTKRNRYRHSCWLTKSSQHVLRLAAVNCVKETDGKGVTESDQVKHEWQISIFPHFNGRFSSWTWVNWYQNISILDLLELRMEVVVTTGAITTCKAPVNCYHQ